MMEEMIVRKLVVEYLEQRYQKSYTETCLSGNFDLKFISEEASAEKCNYRATWIASFFLNLTEFEANQGIEFFPVSVDIYLDDKTGEAWTPSDPYRKLTSQEKRVARKERRQTRQNWHNSNR